MAKNKKNKKDEMEEVEAVKDAEVVDDDMADGRKALALSSGHLPKMLNSELSRIESLGGKLNELEKLLLADDLLEQATPAELLKIYNTISKSREGSAKFLTKMMELGMESKVFERLLEGMGVRSDESSEEDEVDKNAKNRARYVVQELLKKRTANRDDD